MPPQLNVLTAFLAGLISFGSPCVLPLVPSYLSFLTGTSLQELQSEQNTTARLRVLSHALAFVSGFTLVFVLAGLSSSALGSSLAAHKELIARIGGAAIIALGLNMVGIFRLPFLAMDKRFHPRPTHDGSLWPAFVVGIGFAAGWSPCIGPILSTILLMAAQREVREAGFLLFVYAMGLAVPFLLTAFAITQSLALLQRVKPLLPIIERTSGVILAITGAVFASDSFPRVAGLLYHYIKVPSL